MFTFKTSRTFLLLSVITDMGCSELMHRSPLFITSSQNIYMKILIAACFLKMIFPREFVPKGSPITETKTGMPDTKCSLATVTTFVLERIRETRWL